MNEIPGGSSSRAPPAPGAAQPHAQPRAQPRAPSARPRLLLPGLRRRACRERLCPTGDPPTEAARPPPPARGCARCARHSGPGHRGDTHPRGGAAPYRRGDSRTALLMMGLFCPRKGFRDNEPCCSGSGYTWQTTWGARASPQSRPAAVNVTGSATSQHLETAVGDGPELARAGPSCPSARAPLLILSAEKDPPLASCSRGRQRRGTWRGHVGTEPKVTERADRRRAGAAGRRWAGPPARHPRVPGGRRGQARCPRPRGSAGNPGLPMAPS